eukprot:scaffold2013_cov139-Amphora_coffeaeformis.AAC.6
MPTSPQGIDFSAALAILSSRSSGKEENKEEPACPCEAPEGASSFGNMGQIIDLQGGNNQTSSAIDNTDNDTEKTKASSLRKQELLENVRKMSTRQLLQSVLEAQQQRVATYREYDRGLQAVLGTNNVSYYPTVCTEATAAFSVVSDTLQALQGELKGRDGDDEYVALVQSLQQHEQEKLQYTAALHLEQIRLHHATQEEDAATKHLLEESTRSLQTKLAGCVSRINEALEEIQCSLVDAPSDDGTSG